MNVDQTVTKLNVYSLPKVDILARGQRQTPWKKCDITVLIFSDAQLHI